MENKERGLPAVGGHYFPSVKKARAALMAHANAIVEKYLKLIDMAMANGDFETANKALQFLMEHMPPEEGQTVIAESAAKTKQLDTSPKGPVIQIGVRVGGVNEPAKALPDVIIDAESHTTE